jgi:MYXO-CTERM domain-containing protein
MRFPLRRARAAFVSGLVVSLLLPLQALACGNGALEGGEQCDDGNLLAGDGCSPTCLIEPGYRCAGTRSVCTSVCGDGIRSFNEACDDNNTNPGDGCSAACLIEPGWSCVDTQPNLITNGSFASGNAGFRSQYMFSDVRNLMNGRGGGSPEGNYTVTNNPAGWHEEFAPFGAITWRDADGDGWASLFNGVPNLIAYETTANVTAGQDYLIQASIADWGQFNRARIYFAVDNTATTPVVQPPSSEGFAMRWTRMGGTFRSARTGTVSVQVIDLETASGGNDFGVDGISLVRSAPSRCTQSDRDGDGIPDDEERRIGSNPDDPDTDRDSIRDGDEIGPNRTMPQDTDMDGVINILDPDDDGDTVPTFVERNFGTGNRNTDMDANPDHLDPDDDNDTIPTELERRFDPSDNGPDGDPLPSYRDLDSDGDGVSDQVEAGPNGNAPADTDFDGARDFLDLDSDNDCLADSTPAEAGAARTNAMTVMDPCTGMAGLVCDRSLGRCLPTPDDDRDRDGIRNGDETRIGTNPDNPDTDGDGIPDGTEVPNISMPRDSDMDGMIDANDPDDDNDTIPTRRERPGLQDRNTDGDSNPDHLDPDDDNDTIPTRVERASDPTDFGPDRDFRPSFLDTDSDGDGDLDRDEAGADPTNPVDTDMDGAQDFLDVDSDNDCLADSDVREDGSARITALMAMNGACANPNPVCARRTGRCVTNDDRDGDGLRDGDETRIGTNPDNPDTDMDGIPDGEEVPDLANPRDTDMDGMIDARDPDDDNDSIPTRTERPNNVHVDTDLDSRPDHLDPDDDGDTIPTRTERMIDPSDEGPDRDGFPSHRDRDSDGDFVLDREEAGADPNNPVDTDMDGARDFLDLDSDNDCLPDWDVREAGAARTNPMAPNMSADANCGAGQMCDRTRGVCVPRSTTDAGITDAGPQDSGVVMVDAGPQDSGVVMVDAGPQDSGVVMMDAGSPPTDAGVDPLLNLTGGGCSVESRNPSGLAGAFAALAALAALRIRRRRR